MFSPNQTRDGSHERVQIIFMLYYLRNIDLYMHISVHLYLYVKITINNQFERDWRCWNLEGENIKVTGRRKGNSDVLIFQLKRIL